MYKHICVNALIYSSVYSGISLWQNPGLKEFIPLLFDAPKLPKLPPLPHPWKPNLLSPNLSLCSNRSPNPWPQLLPNSVCDCAVCCWCWAVDNAIADLIFSIVLGVNALVFCCNWRKIPCVVSPNFPATRTFVNSSCKYHRCANRHTTNSPTSFSGLILSLQLAWIFTANFKQVSMYLTEAITAFAIGFAEAFTPDFEPWKCRSPDNLCLARLSAIARYSDCSSSICMSWKPLFPLLEWGSLDRIIAWATLDFLLGKSMSSSDSPMYSSSKLGLDLTITFSLCIPDLGSVTFKCTSECIDFLAKPFALPFSQALELDFLPLSSTFSNLWSGFLNAQC